MTKSLFFGQYLFNKKVINFSQLGRAVILQAERNLKIGQLAVEKKLLTPDQIKQIIEIQKKEDIFFGEAAHRLGFFSSEKIIELLTEQKQRHLYLGEALVELGYLSRSQLKEELDNFITEQAKNGTSSTNLYPDSLKHEQPIIETFTNVTIKILQRMSNLPAKYDFCQHQQTEFTLAPISIQMNFSGFFSKRIKAYLFMVNKDIGNILAANIHKNFNITTTDIPTEDVLTELVNVICGQVCHKFSEKQEMETTVPQKRLIHTEQQARYVLADDETAAVVTLFTPFGEILFSLLFSAM